MAAVRVAVRLRPFNDVELERGARVAVAVRGRSVLLKNDKSFPFDSAFPAGSTQEQVYQTTAEPMIPSFVDGYNCTVFCYGQTGSGKSYTVSLADELILDYVAAQMGQLDISPEDEAFSSVGLIPRIIADVYKAVGSEVEARRATVSVSYLEIYNETLRDLLKPASRLKPSGPSALQIQEKDGVVTVSNLSSQACQTAQDAIRAFYTGTLLRTTAATDMNARSSRSHAVFTITLETQRIRSKFTLVDLAGSERQKKSNVEGLHLKELIGINSGLLALGNVISALITRGRTGRDVHIPYRDSKLTRILQESLGGSAQTYMIACVSPADINFEETQSTVLYAARARNVVNKPVQYRRETTVTYSKEELDRVIAKEVAKRLQDMGYPGAQGGLAPRGLVDPSDPAIHAKCLEEIQFWQLEADQSADSLRALKASTTEELSRLADLVRRLQGEVDAAKQEAKLALASKERAEERVEEVSRELRISQTPQASQEPRSPPEAQPGEGQAFPQVSLSEELSRAYSSIASQRLLVALKTVQLRCMQPTSSGFVPLADCPNILGFQLMEYDLSNAAPALGGAGPPLSRSAQARGGEAGAGPEGGSSPDSDPRFLSTNPGPGNGGRARQPELVDRLLEVLTYYISARCIPRAELDGLSGDALLDSVLGLVQREDPLVIAILTAVTLFQQRRSFNRHLLLDNLELRFRLGALAPIQSVSHAPERRTPEDRAPQEDLELSRAEVVEVPRDARDAPGGPGGDQDARDARGEGGQSILIDLYQPAITQSSMLALSRPGSRAAVEEDASQKKSGRAGLRVLGKVEYSEGSSLQSDSAARQEQRQDQHPTLPADILSPKTLATVIKDLDSLAERGQRQARDSGGDAARYSSQHSGVSRSDPEVSKTLAVSLNKARNALLSLRKILCRIQEGQADPLEIYEASVSAMVALQNQQDHILDLESQIAYARDLAQEVQSQAAAERARTSNEGQPSLESVQAVRQLRQRIEELEAGRERAIDDLARYENIQQAFERSQQQYKREIASYKEQLRLQAEELEKSRLRAEQLERCLRERPKSASARAQPTGVGRRATGMAGAEEKEARAGQPRRATQVRATKQPVRLPVHQPPGYGPVFSRPSGQNTPSTTPGRRMNGAQGESNLPSGRPPVKRIHSGGPRSRSSYRDAPLPLCPTNAVGRKLRPVTDVSMLHVPPRPPPAPAGTTGTKATPPRPSDKQPDRPFNRAFRQVQMAGTTETPSLTQIASAYEDLETLVQNAGRPENSPQRRR